MFHCPGQYHRTAPAISPCAPSACQSITVAVVLPVAMFAPTAAAVTSIEYCPRSFAVSVAVIDTLT